MGLLSSIGAGISSFVKAITPTKEKLQNVVDVLSIAINPFSKDKISANISNPVVKTTLELVANHPYLTAGVVAGGITAVSNPQVVSTVAKSLVPTTIKGKIAASVAVPIVTGALIQQPAKTIGAAADLPGNLAQFGGNVANFIADPSLSGAKQIFQENPLIAGGAIATALTATGLAIIPAIASIRQTEAINKQTEALTFGQNVAAAYDQNLLAEQKKKEIQSSVKTAGGGAAAAAPVPVLPQTQVLTPTTTHHHHRKPVKQQINRISQRVNVLVGNKTFIKGTSQRSYYGY